MVGWPNTSLDFQNARNFFEMLRRECSRRPGREREGVGNGDGGQGQAETGREQDVEVKEEEQKAGTWTARGDVNGEWVKCGVRMRWADASTVN